MRLTAYIVAYHEEALIEGCIRSIAGVVDELIVCHDGPCRDATLDIAARYTDKCFATERHHGSNDLVCDVVLKQATGDWVLAIDADERLSPELRSRIRGLIERTGIDAYSFRWAFFAESARCLEPRTRRRKPALFRKSKLYRVGLPHMVGETKGVLAHTDLVLEHHLRPASHGRFRFRTMLRKNRHLAGVAAELLAGPPERIATFNCTLEDTHLSAVRKLLFCRCHPVVGLVAMPAYSFLHASLVKGYALEGPTGVKNALNIASYHLFLCTNLALLRSRRWSRTPGSTSNT